MNVPTIQLGDGLTTSAQGLGGMALTAVYGDVDDAESLATLNAAVDLGVTHIDTSNVYGLGTNEELIAKLLKSRRDEVTIATKFGVVRTEPASAAAEQFASRGDRAYARECVEGSLRRLGCEQIDLYYLHRIDPNTPVEESVGAMAELVAEGKVKHLGLSEVTADELRRAHAVHPIAAVQSEWSIWSRDVEANVVPAAAELGVGFVPYSPLGRGFLIGATNPDAAPSAAFLRSIPRFSAENLASNLAIAAEVEAIGSELGLTPAQVALAWLYARARELAVAISPIPGTRRAARVAQNAKAASVELPAPALARLGELAAKTAGARSNPEFAWVSTDRERTGG